MVLCHVTFNVVTKEDIVGGERERERELERERQRETPRALVPLINLWGCWPDGG